MEKLLKQFNLTPQEVRVFKSLLKSGGATVSEIANSTHMKRTSCQEIIRSLEEKGFIVRSKIGNKYLYQTEDPDVFAQMVNERQFLVGKLVQKLNQKPKQKPWSVRAITSNEFTKLVRRTKRKGMITRSFGKDTTTLHVLIDNRLVLDSTDEENPAIEIKSQELADFHLDLLKK